MILQKGHVKNLVVQYDLNGKTKQNTNQQQHTNKRMPVVSNEIAMK